MDSVGANCVTGVIEELLSEQNETIVFFFFFNRRFSLGHCFFIPNIASLEVHSTTMICCPSCRINRDNQSGGCDKDQELRVEL